ncbi:hypothetical protein CGRA01v4_00698 [Colletotrichum graminicola]|nr:hypothetical protein CGRA01v4_00698 [Colletotrichum graminicola]
MLHWYPLPGVPCVLISFPPRSTQPPPPAFDRLRCISFFLSVAWTFWQPCIQGGRFPTRLAALGSHDSSRAQHSRLGTA